jgi:hypothetical protein
MWAGVSASTPPPPERRPHVNNPHRKVFILSCLEEMGWKVQSNLFERDVKNTANSPVWSKIPPIHREFYEDRIKTAKENVLLRPESRLKYPAY